ncbi:MAG: hypothetical protein K9L02_01950 [Acholeplasmataceae bacterium]|nr:hypothetical protein [Acholeplasmataceae bacterium]
MRDVHKIALIGIVYAIVLSLVVLIFFTDYVLWAVLGSAVALLNHGQMIRLTDKNRFRTDRLVLHLVQRYVLYFIIIAFVWFDTKELGTPVMIRSYIVLLLGIFSLKVGVFIYWTPLFKKPKEENIKPLEEEEENDDQSNFGIL